MTSSSEAPAKSAPAKVDVRKLGKYELQKQLGAGGMGTVYLAKDTQLKRLVALKILSRDRAANPTLVKRFQAEAQAAAQLRHDNIVAIYENGEIDGYLFIAMEYVDGNDVQELIRKRGKIPVKRALEIVKQVALALKHADEHHIVHRDIKPSNVLVRNDGAVKLTDLGLARSVDDTLETDITRAGTTVGTIDYMAPEQARSSKLADIRSDIYSLGCTWYHMLTGKPPFSDGSMTNKLQAHAVKPPPDPRDDNDTVTEATVAVLQRMLAKKPEDRYQTPDELLKDLGNRSLTKGGHTEEVYSAISETDEVVDAPKPAKRGLPAGALPPKQKVAAQNEEEAKFTWEAIQPYVWGGLVLSVAIGLGLLVAGLSGGLDFGGGPVAKPTDLELGPGETPTMVGSQNPNSVQGQGSPTSVTTPEAKVVASDDPNAVSNPDQPPQVTSVQPQPTGNPNTPNTGTPHSNTPTVNTPAVTNPAGGTTTTTPPVNRIPRTVDPEAVPTWSNPPVARVPNPAPSGQPGTTPKVGPTPVGQPNQPGTTSGPTIKTFTVGAGAKTGTHFPLLADALRAAPAEGAVVQFTGPGPYELPQLPLANLKRLILVAAQGQQPVVMLRPGAGEPTAGLELSGGALEIDGLHFVLDRAAFVGSEPVKMLSVVDGQLTVRRSTFSVWGNGTTPVWAMHVDSRLEPQGLLSPLEPRVLTDQVFVRGDQVTALSISRPCADVVVRDSLFVSGTAPVVQLSGKFSEEIATFQAGKPRRAVRVLQSTLFGKHTIFQVSADGAEIPPVTAISLLESVLATSGPAGEAQLLSAVGWPQTTTATPTGKLVNLSWLMKNSVAFGFSRLADFGPESPLHGNTVDEWQTLWNQSFTATQFPETAWPAGPLADLSSLRTADFHRETLPAKDVLRPDNSPPGCDAPLLPNPAAVSRRRLSAIAAKPQFPPPSAAAPPQTVQIDAGKQDLGRELQAGAWPAGTLIEVTGAGLRPMTPVKLLNKSWRIVGKPQDGAPLTFTPKSVATDLDGLIVVERGSLELSNLRFQIATTKKNPINSLIIGRDARLTLDNVDLQGALTDATLLDSLLHWSGGAARADGTTAFLACQDATFIGSGCALRLELGAGPVFLRNCLVACRGDGLDVRLPSTIAGPSPGPLLADHVTFSATLGAIHLRSDATDPARPPHRFYFDQCAFVPPLSSRSSEGQTPTVFSLTDPNVDLRAVEWWGASNGISPDVPSLIRAEQDVKPDASSTGLSRWQTAWSEEQDTRFLTGAGGVVMTESLANKTSAVKPSSFALHPNCQAAQWGDGNQPIGADVRRLEPKPATKPKDAGKKPPGKGPVTPDF